MTDSVQGLHIAFLTTRGHRVQYIGILEPDRYRAIELLILYGAPPRRLVIDNPPTADESRPPLPSSKRIRIDP